MIETIAALQCWIYDTFKTAMGMGTTGGKQKFVVKNINRINYITI